MSSWARLSSARQAWEGLISHYAQVDPIAQESCPNTTTCKGYIEGGTETLLESYCELQMTVRDMRRTLGSHLRCAICRRDYTIHAHTLMGSVIGTLGGILDPKIIISRLNMERSQRQGLTSSTKIPMLCSRWVGNRPWNAKTVTRTSHTKVKCWQRVEA